MGQKTNPKGFRLVTNQQHFSRWYSEKHKYSELTIEDAQIRDELESKLNQILALSQVTILRSVPTNVGSTETVRVSVKALFPGAQEMIKKLSTFLPASKLKTEMLEFFAHKNTSLKSLVTALIKKEIRKSIRLFSKGADKLYKIEIKFLKNRFEDPKLIARFVAEQLERRVPFRRTVKLVIKKVKRTYLKGIKIEISGRLNGTDIARSEWKRSGQVPLHTLNANIDYTHHAAETVYGTLGIKVWLTR